MPVARLELAVAIGVTGVAVLLQIVFLGHGGALWRDEVNGVNTAASPSLAEMWRRLDFESAPALSLLLLRGWMAVGGGSTDSTLRLFGFLSGLALPVAVWLAARKLGRMVPLVGLALIAVNPEFIRWTASIRAWGLGAALIVAAFAWIGALSRPFTRRTLVVAGGIAILSVQCVYQNAVLLAAPVAGAFAAAYVLRARRVALAAACIGGLAALSLGVYAGTFQRRADWDAINRGAVSTADIMAKSWTVVASNGAVVSACWVALVATGLAAFAAACRRSIAAEDRAVASYSVVALAASVVGLLVFYRLFRYPTQSWYYVSVLALVAVCSETAVAVVARSRAARMARVAAAVVVIVAGARPAWSSLQLPQTNLDEVGRRLTAEAAPEDLIVVNPWFLALTLDRHYTGRAAVVTLPPMDDRAVHRHDLVKQAMQDPAAMAPVLARIQHTLKGGHRVWFLGDRMTMPAGTQRVPLPPPPLARTGWSASPYLLSWLLDAAELLRDHAEHGRNVVWGVRAWPLEDVKVGEFWGWRD